MICGSATSGSAGGAAAMALGGSRSSSAASGTSHAGRRARGGRLGEIEQELRIAGISHAAFLTAMSDTARI